MGPQGEIGYTGPTGWSGKCLNSFIRIYNDVPQTVVLNTAITFNNRDIVKGPIWFVPGTGQILLEHVGYYLVLAKVFHIFAVQAGLFLNGNKIVGSVIGESATTAILVFHEIIKVTAADLLPNPNAIHTGVAAILEIRNHSSYADMEMDGREGAGTETDQINASMTIVQICDEDDNR